MRAYEYHVADGLREDVQSMYLHTIKMIGYVPCGATGQNKTLQTDTAMKAWQLQPDNIGPQNGRAGRINGPVVLLLATRGRLLDVDKLGL